MRYLFYLAFILSLASPLTAQLFDVTKKLKGDTTGLAAGEEVTQYSFTVGGTGSASREGKSGAGQIGIQAWKNGRFFSTLLLNIAANNRFNNNDSSQISIYLLNPTSSPMSLYLSGNLTIFKKLGVYGRILGSNFELSVEDQDKPINSQLGSLSIGLSYIFSPKIKSNVYQVGFATGVTSRHILGDLKFDSNKPYRESILGFTDPSLTSWEYSLYVRANNNIYYFVRYADFQLGKNIDGVSRELKGFSDGRFCFGVSASGDFFRF